MEIEDLEETAALVYLNLGDGEFVTAFPIYGQMRWSIDPFTQIKIQTKCF